MKKMTKRVMVFGVFDRLHEGHRYFLKKAKKYGGKLIVVVARDKAAFSLKKRNPEEGELSRLAAVGRIPGVYKAVLGDKAKGSYTVVKRYKPYIICLGYDQKLLGDDLLAKMRLRKIPRVRLILLKSHRPDKFHTSKMKVNI